MTILWALTFLILHLLAFAGCCAMVKKAPCWMQRFTVIGLASGMLVFSVGYLILLVEHNFPEVGWWGGWYVLLLAGAIEHIAVLLYIFRLNFQSVLWPTSLEVSRNSPG